MVIASRDECVSFLCRNISYEFGNDTYCPVFMGIHATL